MSKKIARREIRCRINQIMRERGITQEQLALSTNIDRKTIRNMQNNKFKMLSVVAIDNICNYLDIHFWQLFEEVEVCIPVEANLMLQEISHQNNKSQTTKKAMSTLLTIKPENIRLRELMNNSEVED